MKNLSLIVFAAMGLMLSACTGQNLNKDGTSTVNLEQDYQEVIHYDCNNAITSDRIESVSSPTAYVHIDPASWSNLGSSKFLNTSTGSTAPSVWGYNYFWVDHGDGALSMHVISGGNIIQYTFYSCDKWSTDGSGTCAVANTIQEQGTLLMTVNYVEKTIPTPLKVNDCVPPTPTPTPH